MSDSKKNVIGMDEHKARARANNTRAEFVLWDETGSVLLAVTITSETSAELRMTDTREDTEVVSTFQVNPLSLTLERVLAAFPQPEPQDLPDFGDDDDDDS